MMKYNTILLSSLLVMGLCFTPVSSTAQELIFQLSGQIDDDHQTGSHLFGFKDDALLGVDLFDTPEPPLPPGSYMAMCFPMTDPEYPTFTRWRDNFHSPADWTDNFDTWEIVFNTDQSEEICVVSLELISGNAEGLQVRIVKAHTTIDLSIGGTFTVSADEMGDVFILEVRGGQNLVTSISFDGLRCLYR